MMHVRTDGMDCVPPQVVNPLNITGRKRGRMSSEMVRIGASAVMTNNESKFLIVVLFGMFPGLAKKARLF
jgi:hypothetical protein